MHIVAKDSASANASILIFDINKYAKVKIKDIIIYGRKEIVNNNKSFFNK